VTPCAGITRIRFDGRRLPACPLSPIRTGLPCTSQPYARRSDASRYGRSMRHGGIAEARLYLCTDSRRRTGDLADFLDAVLANGVDVVQLREKGLEARQELALLETFAQAAERHGALFAVNDRADIARACRAPVLHLGQDDLPVQDARAIVGDDVIIGRSTHSPGQFDAVAAQAGVDYACAGPTWLTPTKLGRPAAGIELIEHAAKAGTAMVWFAIGGIESAARLDAVIAAGARRVVVVRAITEADDPGAAARDLATRLRESVAN
jgi:thiamine-phosphate pyrophosphorylase